MDPSQNPSGNSSGVADPDLNGSNPRSDVPPVGLNSSTPKDTPQTRNPSPGTTGVTTQSQTGARVWTRTGQNQPGDDPTVRAQSTRPISPTPLAQTREHVAEMASMVASLVDKSRTKEIAYWNIANRLEETERELAEHRANALTQTRSRPDSPIRTPTPRNNGAFGTPEYPSSRSVRYPGKNSQQPFR
ncbi:hypothetical protein Bca4012_020332 [Brassica carinata]